MSFFDALFGQFIDVIAWTDDGTDAVVRRFERHGHEIKYGAKLTVREGQAAVFVHEGRLADVFPPGLYRLKTNNMPILSTLQHWDHGFESPFKSEIYFVSTRRFTDLKWGTRNPVMLRDPEFGPIRLRAFGSYEMRVVDPGAFLREIVGTDGDFGAEEISDHLRNVIVSRFANAIATAHIPALDLAANYDDLGRFVRDRIQPEMTELGIEITKLLVENVSLPPEVEQALDRRSSMGVIGDLRKYAQFQAAEALRASGDATAGVGLGVGMGAGAAMARQMAEALSAPGQATPPALPGMAAIWHAAIDGAAQGPFALEALRGLAAQGRLTRDSLVWREGMAQWAAASEQSDLAKLFAAPATPTPPPLPSS
ncbi:MAG: SPFH domain-containing protein [Rhodobacteraceae bacterium]|nr:SPFH domain-containing protein [Paracoccaceae bacterium]